MANATGSGTSFANMNANIAAGFDADASGAVSANIALGRASNASGAGTKNTAIGAFSTATGTNASAYGANASATHAYSAAFGHDATTTRANQQVYGTSANTYTMPGITSGASKAAQGSVHGLVTTDASGNLASDGGALQAKVDANMMVGQENGLAIDRNKQRAEENEEGAAVSIALSDPDLYAGKTFAVKGNWGIFEGSNALGVSAKGLLADNLFGQGDQLTLSGGIGWGVNENTVGGRVSGQVSW